MTRMTRRTRLTTIAIATTALAALLLGACGTSASACGWPTTTTINTTEPCAAEPFPIAVNVEAHLTTDPPPTAFPTGWNLKPVGQVQLTIDGTEAGAQDLDGGTVIFDIDGLDAGTYEVTANYLGFEIWRSSTDTVTLEIAECEDITEGDDDTAEGASEGDGVVVGAAAPAATAVRSRSAFTG
jgi:hypothetical protein